MSNEKQLEDLLVYVQNLHDRLKVVENWILEFETSHLNQSLSTQEEKAIDEIVKETEELL